MNKINTQDNELMCKLHNALEQSINGFKASAHRKEYEPPKFTTMEFLEWLYEQPEFMLISKLWLRSDYNKRYKPKVVIMSKDDTRYRLNNFRLSNFHTIEDARQEKMDELELKKLNKRKAKDEHE